MDDTNTSLQASMRIRSYFAPAILVLSLTVASGQQLSAQLIRPSAQTHVPSGQNEIARSAQDAERPLNGARAIAGGVLGGGLGLGVGLLGGANLSSGPGCPGEDCGLVGAIVGATLGESIGFALGSHYAGHGRGNLLATTLTSAAIGAAGMAAAFAAEGAAPYIIGITPIIQSAVLLSMER